MAKEQLSHLGYEQNFEVPEESDCSSLINVNYSPTRVRNSFHNHKATSVIKKLSPMLGMTVEGSYTWSIDDFILDFRIGLVDEVLQSPTFSIDSNSNIKWRLLVYPKGQIRNGAKHISLFLSLVSISEGRKSNVQAKYKFSIVDAKGKKIEIKDSQGLRSFVENSYSGFNKFIDRDFLLDEANGLLPNNKLTIVCDVCILKNIIDISTTSITVSSCKLLEDVGSLFHNQKFSDVTLSAGSRHFLAHKAILAARSPVFAGMFEHEMEEKTQNRVIITDIDENVLEEMLGYIYTGKSENIEEMSEKLLVAADKYDLKILQTMCEKALHSSLNTENAVRRLILADRHNVADLKTQAIDFIIKHAADVMNTSAWDMILSHPHLISEAFRAATCGI